MECTDEVKNELEEYIQTSESILQAKYEGSPLEALERIILNPAENIKLCAGVPEIDGLNLERTFIALIAPSFAGKTQSAFVMRNVRPLYFALDFNAGSQRIYQNFESLSKELIENASSNDLENLKETVIYKELYAEIDKESVKRVKSDTKNMEILPDRPEINFRILSAESLLKSFRSMKFRSLGFIKALIQKAESKFQQENDNWMRFFSQMDGFYYAAVSLDEFIEFFSKIPSKYCLFLDEFTGKETNLLMRNLARAVSFKCIVSNTNSDINNFVGFAQAGSSRSEKMSDSDLYPIWSIVFNRLNNANWDLIFGKLDGTIQTLISNCKEKNAITYFFNELKTNIIEHMLPGIAHIIAQVLVKFELELKTGFPFVQFINELISLVGDGIIRRKRQIRTKISGSIANFGLYNYYAYESDLDSSSINSHAQSKTFLLNHLYYLWNPVDKTKFSFLTITPEFLEGTESSVVRIYRNKMVQDWKDIYTYFREQDFLLILSCISLTSPNPVFMDIESSKSESRKLKGTIHDTGNPLAIKLDGNELEMIATVTIIESSHHPFGSKTRALEGQPIDVFVKNIANNLISTTNDFFDFAYPYHDSETGFDLENFLKQFHVPFLYPSNCEIPEVLEKLTSDNVINVGYCGRTADKEKIDFKFSVAKEPTDTLACVECKNWAQDLPLKDLIDILSKSLDKPECAFNFLFCNSIVDTDEVTKKVIIDRFHGFCKRNKVNVYTFEKCDSLELKVVPFATTLLNTEPLMISFIFELQKLK